MSKLHIYSIIAILSILSPSTLEFTLKQIIYQLGIPIQIYSGSIALILGNQPVFRPILVQGHLISADQSSSIDDIDLNATKCEDCRLTSDSIEALLRKPRLIDDYGQVEAKVDLDKIHQAVCKDILKDSERERCRNFYFSHLPVIQTWKETVSKLSFLDYVCIRQQKYCCPRGSYGTRCSKCPSCDKSHRCHGEGTRSGSGRCICKEGHSGQNCETCTRGYYSNSTTDVTCLPCHRSCSSCSRGTPLGCQVCQTGYVWIPGHGCFDEDECLKSNNKICGENTFCVNTEGSYFCYECDRACNGCHGDGPDMCLQCANGYKKEKEACVALKKTVLPPEANYYRYAIYLGLCISTYIIFHNSVYIASFIGLGVAIYIGTSEYIMSTHLDDMEQNLKHSL